MRNIIIFMLLICAISALNATSVSTATGGLWSDASTWVMGSVPPPGDDVYIAGPVQLNQNVTVGELFVYPAGNLTNYPNTTYTLEALDDITVQGQMTNSPGGYLFDIYAHGDLSVQGVLDIHTLRLMGDAPHIFEQVGDGEFTMTSLTRENGATGNIGTYNPLTLNCNTMNLDGGSIIMVDTDLTLDGSTVSNTNFSGMSSGTFTADGGVFFTDVTISQLTLDGTHTFSSGCALDQVYNMGVIQNRPVGNYSIEITGDFVNDGEVRNNPSGWLLNLNIYDNVHNGGTWDMNALHFLGASQQTISAGGNYNVAVLYCENTGGLILDTPVYFDGSTMELYNHTISLNGYNLILDGYSLSNGAISGTSGEHVFFYNGANSLNIDYTNLTLEGEHNVYGNDNTYTGVTNDGVMQNRQYGNYTAYMYDGFVNHGQMRRNPAGYNFSMRLEGDLLNEGDWDIATLVLADSTQVQTITCGAGDTLAVNSISVSNAVGVALGSDVIMDIGTCNLDNLPFHLNGHDLYLDGGLQYTTVYGSNAETITGAAGSYMQHVEIDDVTLAGEHCVYGSDCLLFHVTNAGVLQPYVYNNYTVTISGGFVNNGSLQNNTSSGRLLTANVYGDIVNNGDWNIRQFSLVDSVAQSITSPGLAMTNTYFDCNNGVGLIAGSDLTFVGSDYDFHDSVLDLSGGWDAAVDATFHDVIVDGGVGSTLTGNDDFWYNMTLQDLNLSGVLTCGSNVYFDHVVNNGVVQNYTNTNYAIAIDGPFINNGEIRNNVQYHLTANLTGNLTNNGVWDVYQLTLLGDEAQTVAQADSCPMLTTYFDCPNDSGMVAGSDLVFSGADFDWRFNVLDLTAGYSIDVDGTLHGVEAFGGPGTVMTAHDDYWYFTTLHDLTTAGVMNFGSGVYLHDITNSGVMQNYTNNNYTIDVLGDFVNSGAVQSNPVTHHLSIDCTGDVTNYGHWDMYQLRLEGVAPQTITSPDSTLAIDRFIDSGYDYPTYAGSDLTFQGTVLDLNDSQLYMTSQGRADYDLTLNGAYCHEAEIYFGDTSTLNLSNNVRFEEMEVYNATLYGELMVTTGVEFYDLTNEGVIENYTSNNHTVELHGHTINNGEFRKHPISYSLYVDIFGDFDHNGDINTYRVRFMGDEPQTMNFAPGSEVTLHTILSVNSADTLYWNGDVVINNSSTDLNNDTLIMQDDCDLTINGGYLREAKVFGDGNLTINDDAYLQTVNVDDFDLYGEVRCRNDVTLVNAAVMDTLRNDSNGTQTVRLAGDCANYGLIHHPAYSLYLTIQGDFLNDGVVDVNRFDINGLEDQTIHFEQGAEIDTETRIYSDIGVVSWYYNGASMSTSAEYVTLPSINNGWVGLFNGESAGAWTRDIHIISPPEQPQHLLISVSGADVVLTWDEAAGAVRYVLQSASEPDGVFTIIEPAIVDPTPGDGVVQWTLPLSAERGYYRVIAEN